MDKLKDFVQAILCLLTFFLLSHLEILRDGYSAWVTAAVVDTLEIILINRLYRKGLDYFQDRKKEKEE